MLNKKPLVTIVIPAYNHENFIQAAIRSVIAQTYSKLQLIVINDGSTDKTAQKIREMKKNYKFTFIDKKNEGIGKTLNLGLKLAKGEIFYYLASDDQLLPATLEKIVAAFQVNSIKVGLIYGKYTTSLNFKNSAPVKNNSINEGLIWQNILKNSVNILGPVCFFRTSALRQVGGFSDLLPLEDFYVLLKITYRYQACYLPEVLVFYRLHSSNTSKNYRKIGAAAFMTIELFFREFKINNSRLKKIAYSTRYYWLSWLGFNNKDRKFALANYVQAFWHHPSLLIKDLNFVKSFFRTLLNIF